MRRSERLFGPLSNRIPFQWKAPVEFDDLCRKNGLPSPCSNTLNQLKRSNLNLNRRLLALVGRRRFQAPVEKSVDKLWLRQAPAVCLQQLCRDRAFFHSPGVVKASSFFS